MKLVKYHNKINEIPLRHFSEKELNIFFTLIFKSKEQGTNRVVMNFSELKQLGNTDAKKNRLIKAIQTVEDKLISLNQRIEVEEGVFETFTLFNKFKLDTNKNYLEVQINDTFQYMLNDLVRNYTKFDLIELVNLKSSYSKNMFRLLKQYESTKMFIITLEEFKRILCIPESYKMGSIDQKVLNPILSELTPIFPELKMRKIKSGRRIDRLEFRWQSVNKLEKMKEVEKIVVSEKLNNSIEKAKKNRFISPLLKINNLDKLINKYTEDELIKGLNFAHKEIKREIKTLRYLEKTIESALLGDTKTIVVEKVGSKQPQYTNTNEENLKELREETISPITKMKNKMMYKLGELGKTEIIEELKQLNTLEEIKDYKKKYDLKDF